MQGRLPAWHGEQGRSGADSEGAKGNSAGVEDTARERAAQRGGSRHSEGAGRIARRNKREGGVAERRRCGVRAGRESGQQVS